DPNLAIRTSHGDVRSPALRLVLLGDSSALGVGVDRVADTVGGRLAELLVADGYRVELSSVAVVGSRSADLATQVARALLGPRPDKGTFSHDGFHPSADGYRVWAHALAPAIRDAVRADSPT